MTKFKFQNTRENRKLLKEAGQQSQQGEVDRLQTKLDELQARVDVVLKACDNLRKDIIREHHAEYDKGWKDCATSIYHQLKGNKDD